MNIWSLPKDVYLKHLLLALAERHGLAAIQFDPRWDQEQQALGLAQPDFPGLVAYVYTYGQEPGTFGIHLEYPELPDSPGRDVRHIEGADLEAALDLIGQHLDL